MTAHRREFYRSSNGDRWSLSYEPGSGQLAVLHEPNAPSGGRSEWLGVGRFLVTGGQGPEHQELLRLIGTLLDGPAVETSRAEVPAGRPRSSRWLYSHRDVRHDRNADATERRHEERLHHHLE